MKFVIALLLLTTVSHDFHMAKTEIRVNDDKQRYELSQFVYLDDLQAALDLEGHPSLALCSPSEKDSSDVFILDYLRKHMVIVADGVPLDSLDWIGKEISDDLAGVYIYYAFNTDNTSPKQLNLKNTIFTELFDDQKNLVYITHSDGKKNYLLLDSSNTEEEIYR